MSDRCLLPEAIEDGRHNTAVRRMGDFDDVHRSCSRSNVDAKAEQESAAHELLNPFTARSHTLDNSSDNHAKAPDPHPESSSEGIGGRSHER